MVPFAQLENGTYSSSVSNRLGKSRRTARRSGPRPQAAVKEVSTCSPLSIVSRDWQYLQDHAGEDLINTLAPVREAHEQVAAALNPLVKEKLADKLQDEIDALQAGLNRAHEEVHALEDQLSETIGYLSGLERSSESLQNALQSSQHTSPLAGSQDQQNRADPSNSASTSERQEPRRNFLYSDLELSDALKPFWYPVEFSRKLKKKGRKFTLFNEPWEILRDKDGNAFCQARRVVNGESGSVDIQEPQVLEQDGFVYVWTGSGPPSEKPTELLSPPAGFTVHAELELEVPVEHGLLLENLLDLAHAPFTHTSTFAKGWPIPDIVKFHEAHLLGGNWEPYPINMSFQPPCGVLSTIGLAQPGKIERGLRAENCTKHLHQLHICLPAGTGRTRLLYRMSMDFLEWTKHVPFIQKFWAKIAGQVLGEDLVLVKGQQERLIAGANVWANPVSYDKLGIKYRRWRNTLASGSIAEQEQAKAELGEMAAGELFSLMEDNTQTC